ncbi:hypothetical protein [Pedobacter frigoris]|uniref:Uncharacterized protein n=1 Tax=Pedobacter frigoris TaxID=2571272 RepID=A0A4U1CPW6_9SPHI|nr:hypothetical protein [Pedobacter frigoris]TKC09336.1 hypothetical protein FA047_04380 [Pedobacter frigoris]
MADKNKLIQDLRHFEQLEAKDQELIHKLNEFIALLEGSKIDTENIHGIKTKINQALDKKLTGKELIKQIQDVSSSDASKFDQLSQLEDLLNNNYIDSVQAKKIGFGKTIVNIVKLIIGFLFVTLGFAMIIMPAPPYFEMFVIFNFNADDGFTLMDLISLIIIVIGIYIVLNSLIHKKKYE